MVRRSTPTVWVLGDQLNKETGALAGRTPTDCRVLMVESDGLIASRRWHRQRAHLVLSAMQHFAGELRDMGFDVDYRTSSSLHQGLRDHLEEFGETDVIATEPNSWNARTWLQQWGVQLVRNASFMRHYDEFASWAKGRQRLTMEDFYRWQRVRHRVLLEPGQSAPQPAGGNWNFDHDNREPPPRDGRSWPNLTRFELDDIDRAVLARLPSSTFGADPTGIWPVTREQALIRLREFTDHALPVFGPHEDAMLANEWKLLLGVVGRIADVDATVRLVRGEEATHLAGAQIGESDTFPGVALPAVLGESDRRHALLEAAQHAAGFDRLELVGIADQDES